MGLFLHLKKQQEPFKQVNMNSITPTHQNSSQDKQMSQKKLNKKKLKNETSITKVSEDIDSYQVSIYKEINIVSFKRGLSHLENNYLSP